MVSMKEIAQATGVSRTTVSFVLNGRAAEMKISSQVTEKVCHAAKRMGYIRNDLVRSVVKGKSLSIAVVTLAKNYMLPAICGFIEEANFCNYHVNLVPFHGNIDDALTRAAAFRPAGIYVMEAQFSCESISPVFRRMGIPTLGVHAPARMNFDQKGSSRKGTEHLLSLGHRDIVYIAGNSSIAAERQAGYTEVMTENGLSCKILSGTGMNCNENLLKEIISSKATAVQCFNDYFAFQLMQQCYAEKLFIPEEFSLLGFGNLPAGEWTSPALSTVDEPYYETGVLMFRRMRDLIENGKEGDYGLLCGEVIQRKTIVPLL